MTVIQTISISLLRRAARAFKVLARVGTGDQCSCELGGRLLRDVGLAGRSTAARDGIFPGHMDRSL